MIEHASMPTRDLTDAADMAAGIHDDGFSFCPGAMTADEAAEMRGRIDALSYLEPDGRHSVVDGRRTGMDHYKCVFNRDPYWLQWIDRPGFIEPVENLLGPECHIIGMSAWRSFPGSGKHDGRRPLHVDQLFFPMDEELLTSGRVQLPVFIMTLHFYLSECDLDLCPTWVVPGSHKSGRGPGGPAASGLQSTTIVKGDEWSWNGTEERPVLTKPGDAMLFRAELWHRGSENRTPDQTRYLLQVHYGTRGMAQRFPPYLEFRHDPAVVAAANERQLRMIGKHRIAAYG